MRTINRFFAWWKKTYRQQGRIGKGLLFFLTLSLTCCLCSIPVAIFSSNSPANPTTQVVYAPPATQTGKGPVILLPTNTFVPSATSLSELPVAPSLTATEIPASTQPTGLSSTPLRVYYFDVGQGDSILVLSPDGSTVLIDGGEPDTGVVSYLQGLGVKRIDLMVATHPHSDHIGGLVQVLNALPVSQVVANGQISTTQTFEHFLDAISNNKVPFTVVKRGDNLAVGSLTFSVLSPVTPTGDDLNNNSIVLRLVYGEISFLFMGDADKNAEAGILDSGLPVQATILKVGHHGSNTSSSPAFLAQVKPAVAIYMAGLGNSYNHPNAETLAALASVGAQIYGTDINGTIIVSTDGHVYQVDVQKNETRPPPTATPRVVTLAPTLTLKPTLAFTLTKAPIIPIIGQLEIVSVTSPASRNSYATLIAQTSPNASCSIAVHYKTTISKAAGLGPKNANSNGTVSWTWKIGSSTTIGTWPIDVTCNGVTKSTTFKVQ